MLWQGEWRHRLANGQYNIKVWRPSTRRQEPASSIIEAGLARVDPDQGPVLAVVMVALRLGCHARKRRGVPPLLQARPDPADRSGEHRLSAGHQRAQLLRAPSSISSAACCSPIRPTRTPGCIRSSTTTTSSATPVLGGELSFNAHARSLTRSDGTDTSRVVLEADWRRKMIDPVGQVWTPFGQLRGDVYSYSDAVDPDHPAADPGRHGRCAASPPAGVALLLSLRRAHGVRVARDRADGPDHRAPEPGRSAPPARRGRQEPDLRRHAAVRYRQVLRLRPLRDGHARQRRRCSTRCRPSTASTRARCSARASSWRATTPTSIRALDPTGSLQLLAGQRPRDQPLGLRRGPVSVAVHGRQPHHAGALRREGLDAAPQGHR